MYIVCCVLCILCCVFCVVCCVLCIVCCVLCIVYCVLCVVYCVLCIPHNDYATDRTTEEYFVRFLGCVRILLILQRILTVSGKQLEFYVISGGSFRGG